MSETKQKQPNILVIMSDEHGPMFSSTYGHRIVKTPHMDALAARGVTFETAYCNSPLCVPSRASFMAGKYVHRVGAYDNGAPFPAETVTWAHLLRVAGYQVVMDGKMHFVGADSLHGFERQLTRDAHGQGIAGNEWVDWRGGQEQRIGGKLMRQRIEEAGPGRSEHIAFDDDVEAAAHEWLRESERKDKPWCLLTGFLSPHFPLIVPEEFFRMYYPDNVDMPDLPAHEVHNGQGGNGRHPAHERVRRTFNLFDYTPEQIKRARAAYYGLCTFLDARVGRLMAALEETGQLENTVVVYTTDHGEFAGDHGLWWKNDFYEQSSRVPLIVSWPERLASGARFGGAVSLVDLVSTMLDLGGAENPGDLDGDTLVPVMERLRDGASAAEAASEWKDEAICEYFGHATNRPHRMIRTGRWKYCYYHEESPELFDLVADPQEHRNLAGRPEVAAVESALKRRVLAGFDPDQVEHQIRRSQKARTIIGRATGVRRAQHDPDPQGLPLEAGVR
jgi:choline-sulfatase